MKGLIAQVAAAVAFGLSAAVAEEPLCAEIRQTSAGPRLFVDGIARSPRFFYGSPTCLCNISYESRKTLVVPFVSDADTEDGCVRIDGYYGVDPLWFSNARIVDLSSGVTNVIRRADQGEVRTLNYAESGLRLKKGVRYQFIVDHRATRARTYFSIGVSRPDGKGGRVRLPYYYGDTLGEAVKLAAKAGVDFVTFSTDTSWGCEDWWNPPEEPEDYGKIDRACARLIAINPNVLLVPRLKTDAPDWMLQRHPEIRMVFDTGFGLAMSSVSSRLYRKEACAAIERIARHLRAKFPRNFLGLQISGQNSAEWFYMMSTSGTHLSGYDRSTRDAFRLWLKERGDAGWATAEVPTSAERHARARSGRCLEFTRFRQREMSSFLLELGAAVKRGSEGAALAFFFYGYTWELAYTGEPDFPLPGAGETGHYDFEWLMKNAKGKIDAFSAPLSYATRNLTGSPTVMSAAETVLRNGYLWFNEDDDRTHREDMWDHGNAFRPFTDPAITREIYLRNSAMCLLRGYGEWWMDLFGRGWFGDEETWRVRRELAAVDRALLSRKRPYEPQIANVVCERGFLRRGWDREITSVVSRRGFATSGADYGQYFLSDVLADPPKSVKLFYLTVTEDMTEEERAALAALKASRPDATFVENVMPADLTAEAIAVRAKAAGVHLYTPAGRANVCSAEGYVLVQALKEGPLEIDFGADAKVVDALTGEAVGQGPRLTLPFRAGETRLFRLEK